MTSQNCPIKLLKAISKKDNIYFRMLKTCEELSECSTELLKYVNQDKLNEKTSRAKIIDEIADAELTLEILKHKMHINAHVEFVKEAKINKLKLIYNERPADNNF